MSGTVRDLSARTKLFAIDVIRLCTSLPKTAEYGVIGRQLMRSATSVGANYRAAKRSRSGKEFLAKMCIVEEEADESMYWLELLEHIGPQSNAELLRLKGEADELVAIAVASKKTVRRSVESKAL